MTRGYRVWDNENRSYNDPYSSAYYAMTQDGGLGFYVHGDIWKGADPGTYIVEWDTGLKDKNGKMIKEGDICRLIYFERGEGRKRWKKVNEDIEIVELEDGYFKFSNTDQYGIGSELAFSDYGEWSTASGQYKYEAMVIGNIHENPDLLK